MKTKPHYYWFSREDNTTEHQLIPAELGRTDRVSGEITPCRHGLHASPTPFDALEYAQGPILWEVTLTGAIAHGNPVDKYVGRSRTYLRRVDLTEALYLFAAREALGVIHLWDAPQIVSDYLRQVVETSGKASLNKSLRAAARDAAWASARAAAREKSRKNFNDSVAEIFSRY